jgi:putative sugar O-methyltransferase
MSTSDEMDAMVEEVGRASALYRPSRFWEIVGPQNEKMLSDYGLENLKRTVATNYFNWLVLDTKNNQLRNVLRYWLRHPTMAPFLNSMDELGFIRTISGIEKQFGWKETLLYKLFVGLLWELARAEDRTGLAEGVQEPLIGNPFRIWRKGKLISQDLATSIREYSTMLEARPSLKTEAKTVAELGAGYGRLGYVMLQDPGTQYFVFDIPPALAASQWYLSRVFRDEPVFRFRHFDSYSSIEAELSASRVAFFTPNQLEMFPDGYFGVFASISTLPEMTAAQVKNYLQIISRKTKWLVYLKQWKTWSNPDDGYTFSESDIQFANGFSRVIGRDDYVQNAFFEGVWMR